MDSEKRLQQLLDKNDIRGVVNLLRAAETAAIALPAPRVMALLTHTSFAVREAAVALLASVRVLDALPQILRLCDRQHEKDRHVRLEAVRALAAFEGPEVTTALRRACKDQALNVRSQAEALLREKGIDVD